MLFLNTTAACPSPRCLQDFFNSPATGREGLKLVLTPKSKGRTSAAEAGAASAAKSAPRSAAAAGGASAGRSRLSQAGPSMAPAAFQVEGDEEEQELERTQEIELPQASARKAAPLSASCRRSLSRTPGTKIVIIERGTGGRGTPASAARAAAGASAAKLQAQVGIASAPACLPSSLHNADLNGPVPPPAIPTIHSPSPPPFPTCSCRPAARPRLACCPPSRCRQRQGKTVATALRWSRSGRMRAAALRRPPQTWKVRGHLPTACRLAGTACMHASGMKPNRSS